MAAPTSRPAAPAPAPAAPASANPAPAAGGGPRVFVHGEIYRLQRVGGVNTNFDRLLPRLAAAGAEVRLILPPGAADTGAGPGVRVEPAFPLTARLPWLPDALRAAAERWELRRLGRRVDAVAGTLYHPTYFTAPRPGRGPTVVTVYDMIQDRFREHFRLPEEEEALARKRECVAAARRVLAISEATKADLCSLYDVPPDRVDVTPLATEASFWCRHATAEAADRFRASAGLDRPYLLYVGGRWHYKNFRRLAEAFARWDRRDEFLLAAVGAPLDPGEAELLDGLGVADRVRPLGRLPREELAAAYAGAAAFVYPSLCEGFGLPPLEAMACGTPVAAARAGSIPEVTGDAAELFDPEEVDAIRAALGRVVEPDRAAALRAAGGRRVDAFSWDRTADLTLAAYRRALQDDP